MAVGKPIVCFANPGYQEVLRNYPFQKGLVEVGNVNQLAQALVTLVKDSKLRQELSRWELKEVQKYSWSKVAERILEYYSQIRQNIE